MLAGKEVGLRLTRAGPTARKEALAHLHLPFHSEICFARMLGDSKGGARHASWEAVDLSHCPGHRHGNRDWMPTALLLVLTEQEGCH